MSCYFQRLAIFYHLKSFIEKVKGVEVGQTLLECSAVCLRFYSHTNIINVIIFQNCMGNFHPVPNSALQSSVFRMWDECRMSNMKLTSPRFVCVCISLGGTHTWMHVSDRLSHIKSRLQSVLLASSDFGLPVRSKVGWAINVKHPFNNFAVGRLSKPPRWHPEQCFVINLNGCVRLTYCICFDLYCFLLL